MSDIVADCQMYNSMICIPIHNCGFVLFSKDGSKHPPTAMAGGSNEPLTLVNMIKLRKLKKLGKGITLPELLYSLVNILLCVSRSLHHPF